jgi:hypothetical protein
MVKFHESLDKGSISAKFENNETIFARPTEPVLNG